MKLEFKEKEIFFNVAVGQIFKREGAFWVCLGYDDEGKGYPSICIKVGGEELEANRGDIEFFNDGEEVEIYTLTK